MKPAVVETTAPVLDPQAARISALTIGRPESECCPYNMACYIQELLQIANAVNPDGPPGFGALLTVIEERARTLAEVLDASVFSYLWPQLNERLNADQTLGLKAD